MLSASVLPVPVLRWLSGSPFVAETFGQAPLASQLHVAVRWRLMPFLSLLGHVPSNLTGPALDLGCGHGLWSLLLAQRRPGLQVVGIDPDEPRIRTAQALAAQHGLPAKFAVARMQELTGEPPAVEDVPRGPSLALISILDALYLVPPSDEDALFQGLASRLRPGGLLLLKEMGDRPRWKRAWNHAQESLAVRALGITVGERLYVRREDQCVALLERAGLKVRCVPLHRNYVHPHCVYIGEKPNGIASSRQPPT